MENNPSNTIDNSREIVWMGDGPDGQSSRSYTCTFCKRGFSNAQALGGHMNIHRRDRARLKESSDDHQTLVSSDSTKKPDDHVSDTEDNNNLVQNKESSSKDHEEKSSSLKRLCLFPDEDDIGSPRKKDSAMGEVVQLPLFVEKSLTSNSIEGSRSTGEKMKVPEAHTSSSGLDLELRLGMD